MADGDRSCSGWNRAVECGAAMESPRGRKLDARSVSVVFAHVLPIRQAGFRRRSVTAASAGAIRTGADGRLVARDTRGLSPVGSAARPGAAYSSTDLLVRR